MSHQNDAEMTNGGRDEMKAYEKVWSLNNTSSYVERAFYYDYRGRLIQTVEKNTLGGVNIPFLPTI